MKKNEYKTRLSNNGIEIYKNNKWVKVTNFYVKIVEEITLQDNDGTVKRYVTLKVRIKKKHLEFTIPYEQFENSTWVSQYIGLDAYINFKDINKAEFLNIIIYHSKKRNRILKVRKLGYLRNDDKRYFAYNGGSITSDGKVNSSITASIDGALKHCHFPEIDENDVVADLIQEALDISKIMPNNPLVGTLLLAAVFRAPLNKLKRAEVTTYLVGKTGSGKTTVALIAQSCFGPGFKNPPTSWESTAKSIELTALAASNIVLLIDDFTKVHNDKSALPIIENIIGALGNGVSRGFALSSTQNSDGATIESIPIITGESIPDLMIESRKARTCFCAISSKGDFDKILINRYQKNAAEGVYAKAIGVYIAWILRNYDEIQNSIEGIFNRYQKEGMQKLGPELHSRAPSNYADLMLGCYFFLKFCFEEKHMTKENATKLRGRFSNKLIKLTKLQPLIHEEQDIKHIVLVKMSKLLLSKHFSLVEIKGKQKISKKHPDNFIGWVNHDTKHLYIKSDCAPKILAVMPNDLQDILSTGEKAFWSNLYRFGLLAEKDNRSGKNAIRKTINGKIERVYSLSYKLIDKQKYF